MTDIISSTKIPGAKMLYRTAFAAALISGCFSLIFLAALLWSYFSPYTSLVSDDPAATLSVDSPGAPPFLVLPTDQKQFNDLKNKSREDIANEQLKTEIRELDRKLRYEYFLKHKQNRTAALFFLISSVILVISGKIAVTLRRKIPDPAEENGACQTHLTANQQVTYALLGLGLIACFAGGIVFGLKLSGESKIAEFLLANPPVLLDFPQEVSENSVSDNTSVVSVTPTPAANIDIDPTENRDAFLAMFDKQWPGFRGPDGSGVSRYDNIPTEWDATSGEGIKWKTEVPLQGNSSPVLWENHVFLTGADENQRKVYCFNTESGKLVWDAEIPATQAGNEKTPEVNEETGYASPTAITDGVRVYVIFANGDVTAVDYSGKIVWNKGLGVPESTYGYAASLALWFDRVIVQYDVGDGKDGKSRLLALKNTTGDVLWEVPRTVRCAWPSPIVRKIGESWQILTCAEPFAIAYNPEDGKEIWRCKCLTGDVGPSPTSYENTVYVVNEYPQFSAIDAAQTNELKVLWSATDNLPDAVSPLATENFVYTLASYGFLTAYSVENQSMAWELEVGDGASFYSSPSLAGGKIYCFDYSDDNMNGYVIAPKETEGVILAANPMGEPVVTSPAFADGRIYIRGKKHLFCIESK
ncbi:MAG: PQQ-binding-like beta-propeller repeat protein [Planctomycetaceae bacterium]|jgi:outer membrane protein assembly factor BamB|nr:PQQ-binding-like beta-propeller repeat protein [Planctomycetaceae bacterium]